MNKVDKKSPLFGGLNIFTAKVPFNVKFDFVFCCADTIDVIKKKIIINVFKASWVEICYLKFGTVSVGIYFLSADIIKYTIPPITINGAQQNKIVLIKTPKLYTPPQVITKRP